MIRTIFFLLAAVSVQIHENKAFSSPSVRISESPISRKIEQPTITAIYRDIDKYLWIGTQHGLYKFDGVSLTEYGPDQRNRQWIPASSITGITSDSQKRIVVSTLGGGLLLWDADRKSFRSPTYSENRSHSYITDLIGSKNGSIWTGEKAGLFYFNQGGSTETYSSVIAAKSGKVNALSAIATDTEGHIYAAFSRVVYKISGESNYVEEIFSADIEKNILGKITSIAVDRDSRIYLGTDEGEILAIENRGNAIRARTTLSRGATISVLNLLFHKDNLWIGTNNGLFYTNSNLSVLESYSNENSGLSNDHILTLVGDENFIWVGTYRGLNILSFVEFEVFDTQNSGIFNDVLAFSEDEQNRIWVGTFNGLYRLDDRSGFHENYRILSKSTHIADERVMTLAAKGDSLWVGFQQNGLQIVNTQTLVVTIPDLPAVEQLEVTKILHTAGDRTWVGTYNSGLYLFQQDKTISYLERGLIPEKSIILLTELEDGQILASSENQIYVSKGVSQDFVPLDFSFGDAVDSPRILSISQNRTGDIWIGTKDHGLFVWKRGEPTDKSLKLTQIGQDSGSFLSTVYETQFDEDGNAWCSTQRGIVKLDPSGNILARFSSADGLQGQDFNFGASFKDSLNRIYFGGSNGYNRFYPRDLEIEEEPPHLSMTRVGISVNRKINHFDAIDLKRIQLTHKDYFINFEFSVLDFLDPEKNQYRYMLQGFDPDWIENGNRNSATYTSLPPGEYILRIQGANSAGVWNREGLTLEVEVLPPPWRTWWAFTGYALLVLVALWLIRRVYDSYMIERRARAKAVLMVEAEERADDEMQEQLEIHDDLVKSVYRHSISTLELVGEFIAAKGFYLAGEDARSVTESNLKRVSALALLEECLYYQNDVLLADLNKYTDLIIPDLLKESPVSEENIITINEVSSQPFPIAQASALAIALYELIENAMQHAFEENSAANYLHIILAKEKADHPEARYRLSVQDSGVGMPTNMDTASSQSPGLVIVASMARRLSGVLAFEASNGTLVSISFPAVDDY